MLIERAVKALPIFKVLVRTIMLLYGVRPDDWSYCLNCITRDEKIRIGAQIKGSSQQNQASQDHPQFHRQALLQNYVEQSGRGSPANA
jgi:hypothetical protein